uniref:Uncharacterized protein n=1 Tax=Junco hyemalis TaxID=40217 RepID=A0A8C5NMS5_JUNHY
MELWCALPVGHRASSPGGQVWDLAQALGDGALLFHLLNVLLPHAVPPRDICPRPQMSQVRVPMGTMGMGTLTWFGFCFSVSVKQESSYGGRCSQCQ